MPARQDCHQPAALGMRTSRHQPSGTSKAFQCDITKDLNLTHEPGGAAARRGSAPAFVVSMRTSSPVLTPMVGPSGNATSSYAKAAMRRGSAPAAPRAPPSPPRAITISSPHEEDDLPRTYTSGSYSDGDLLLGRSSTHGSPRFADPMPSVSESGDGTEHASSADSHDSDDPHPPPEKKSYSMPTLPSTSSLAVPPLDFSFKAQRKRSPRRANPHCQSRNSPAQYRVRSPAKSVKKLQPTAQRKVAYHTTLSRSASYNASKIEKHTSIPAERRFTAVRNRNIKTVIVPTDDTIGEAIAQPGTSMLQQKDWIYQTPVYLDLDDSTQSMSIPSSASMVESSVDTSRDQMSVPLGNRQPLALMREAGPRMDYHCVDDDVLPPEPEVDQDDF